MVLKQLKLVMVNAAGLVGWIAEALTVMVNVALLCPTPLLAEMSTVETPVKLGVPLMVRVPASKLRPAGKPLAA